MASTHVATAPTARRDVDALVPLPLLPLLLPPPLMPPRPAGSVATIKWYARSLSPGETTSKCFESMGTASTGCSSLHAISPFSSGSDAACERVRDEEDADDEEDMDEVKDDEPENDDDDDDDDDDDNPAL